MDDVVGGAPGETPEDPSGGWPIREARTMPGSIAGAATGESVRARLDAYRLIPSISRAMMFFWIWVVPS